MRTLYVVTIGDLVKVGTASAPSRRYDCYRAEARATDVPFAVLLELPRHQDADEAERQVVEHFADRVVRGREYFAVPPLEALAFVCTLPYSPAPAQEVGPLAEWIPAREAARRLDRTVNTVSAYARAGHLVSRRDAGRVMYCVDSVECLVRTIYGGVPQ